MVSNVLKIAPNLNTHRVSIYRLGPDWFKGNCYGIYNDYSKTYLSFYLIYSLGVF